MDSPKKKGHLPVDIRAARAEDTARVLELTSKIWDGHDYVPYVWDEWLHDGRGPLLVAEYEQRVVGLVKLTQVTMLDWWMQGLRVDPAFEGHGIASALHDYVLAYWQQHGAGSLRLTTHSQRFPVHHLCDRTGFARVDEYTYYMAASIPDATSAFAPVQKDETFAAYQAAIQNPLSALTNFVMDLGWLFLAPDQQKIEDLILAGRAEWWHDRQGLLLWWEDDDEDDTGNKIYTPTVSLIACEPGTLAEMLSNFRCLAASRGYNQAGWVAPMRVEVISALEQAGFTREWDGSVYLYEKRQAG